MSEEEINKLFHRIELDKSNDSCGFEFADGFGCTFDNIATCYDDRLKLYDLVKNLQQKNYNLILDSNGLINANGILQQELTKYKERCETLLDIIRYYKTTEWGLKSCEILDNFEEILKDKEKK